MSFNWLMVILGLLGGIANATLLVQRCEPDTLTAVFYVLSVTGFAIAADV